MSSARRRRPSTPYPTVACAMAPCPPVGPFSIAVTSSNTGVGTISGSPVVFAAGDNTHHHHVPALDRRNQQPGGGSAADGLLDASAEQRLEWNGDGDGSADHAGRGLHRCRHVYWPARAESGCHATLSHYGHHHQQQSRLRADLNRSHPGRHRPDRADQRNFRGFADQSTARASRWEDRRPPVRP